MTYTELNATLVECFGDLEQLCNQIYHEHHGVTNYIEDMKAHAYRGVRCVPGWDSMLRQLTEVRHKRNQLSHGKVSFNHSYATSEDISFINDFRQSILSQTDPLATLCRQSQAAKSRNTNHPKTTVYTSVSNASNQRIPGIGPVALFILAFAVILLLLYFLR